MSPFPPASLDPALAELLGTLANACVDIAGKLRTAGLSTDVLGAAGATNVQGEQQQKLDVLANTILTDALRPLATVSAIVSEEDDEPIVLSEEASAKYLVIFDPLDGSSNIDVNGPTGTIISIMERPANHAAATAMLQPGRAQVAAMYVLYGPSTVLVYTTKADGAAHAYTLDPAKSAFVLSSANMQMPATGPYYSTNESNLADYPQPFQQAIAGLREGSLTGEKYGARYIGALVADFHRTLLKGGIYLYPPTKKSPNGKLRLLYEANPLAMIAEAAGGAATTGAVDILAIDPEIPHQRVPLVIGSATEVEAVRKLVKAEL